VFQKKHILNTLRKVICVDNCQGDNAIDKKCPINFDTIANWFIDSQKQYNKVQVKKTKLETPGRDTL